MALDGLYGRQGRRSFLLSLHSSLLTERSSFDSHWREISDFLVPRRSRFNTSDRNKGDRRNQNIIDSTGGFAVRTLASGLHAGLTSPSRPWFRLGLPDPDLAKHKPVKEWLHEVARRMAIVFSGSNLYNALPVVYGDMGLFGTSAVAVIPDAEELIRAHVYPIGSYNLGLDRRGKVATFTREYEQSVLQTVQDFGGDYGRPLAPGQSINWSNISQAVKDHWDRGNYTVPVKILWVLTPNPDYRPDSNATKYMRFASCHLEVGAASRGDSGDKVLRESGFKYFPIFAPRWGVTGEDTYGTDSPGITALGDVKMLQIQQRDKGKAIQKQISPPVQAPTALMNTPVNLIPNGVTHVDTRDGMAGLRSIYDVRINLADLSQDMAQVQYRIQRAFYEDLFLMLQQSDLSAANRERTAREIEERHEEKLVALGPMLERTNDDLLNPLIDYTYDRMFDDGAIPEPPEELGEGMRFLPEYISMMAQAQKLVDVGRQDRFVQTAMNLAQIYPEARHKIDVMYLIDQYADQYGIDPLVIRSTDQAREMFEAEQQQAAAAMAAQTAKDAAVAGKAASETDLERPGTALSRMVEQGLL